MMKYSIPHPFLVSCTHNTLNQHLKEQQTQFSLVRQEVHFSTTQTLKNISTNQVKTWLSMAMSKTEPSK